MKDLWFYQRKTAKEHILFNARYIAQKTELGMKQSVTLENNVGVGHCWTTSDGLSVWVITDLEYPESSAFNMIGQIIIDFLETFENDAEMYTEAEEDTNLKYEKFTQ